MNACSVRLSDDTSQANSATKACKSARSSASLASWRECPRDKLMLQDFGRIDGARPGNKLRDMQRLLGKRGFMPNIPVSQIEKVPGLFIGTLF